MGKARMQEKEDQLGFDDILAEADASSKTAKERKRLAHLPANMDDGLPYFEKLLGRFNDAMIADNKAAVEAIMQEADDLAYKLNGFKAGILADEASSGNVLTRLTAAKEGQIPLWGRAGVFDIEAYGIRIRITQCGIFGIGGPGFAINAIDWDKPFPSETGYRSFVGRFIRGGYRIRRAAFIKWLGRNTALGAPRDEYLVFYEAERAARKVEAAEPKRADPAPGKTRANAPTP